MKRLLLLYGLLLFISAVAQAQGPAVAVRTVTTLSSTCRANAQYTEVVILRSGVAANDGAYRCKNDQSGWQGPFADAASAAPSNATYITETANATLTNEFALASLATGILKNTTTTGVPSIAVAGDFPTLNQNTTGTAANLSGTPALPSGTTGTSQSVDDNTAKLATDAFVLAQAASANPIIDGTAAPGTSTRYARADHVHPTDTSRAPTASPTFTGTVALPTGVTVNGNAQTFPTTAQTLPGMNQANTAGSSFTLDMSAAGATAGHKVPVAAGAAPTANGAFSYDSTANGYVGGVNGTKNFFAMATQLVTFSGPTAARIITIPDAAFTVARTDAANTFTGVQTMTSPAITTPAFSGTSTGTYTLGGTLTINAHTLAGTISGGGNQINNVVIGTTTPLAGSFTAIVGTGETITGTGIVAAWIGANGRTQVGDDSLTTYIRASIRPNSGKSGWLTYTEDSVADRWAIGVKNGDGTLYITSGGIGGTDRITIGSTGNLTATAALLNTGITSDATHTDSAVCQDTTTHQFYAGSGAAGICLGTSSARYKNSVNDLNDGLAQLLRLQPRTFFYSKGYGDNGDHLQYGFVAEEMKLVLPNLVRADVEGRPQSIDYGALWPVTVKAIQELNAKVERLENEKAILHRHTVRRHRARAN